MTDDASTAYICIYCPYNSDNLEALEHHLASMNEQLNRKFLSMGIYLYLGAHEHGCQDAPLTQSATSNITTKASKREAPDDEKVTLKFSHLHSIRIFPPVSIVF
jgi:hypothetical protein